MAQQLSAEPGDDAICGIVGRQIARRVERGADDDGQPDDHDGRRQGTERRVVKQRAVDHVGQGDGLDDDDGCAEGADGKRDPRDPA